MTGITRKKLFLAGFITKRESFFLKISNIVLGGQETSLLSSVCASKLPETKSRHQKAIETIMLYLFLK